MPKSKYRKRDFQIYVTVRTRDPLANRSFIGPVAVRQNRRPGAPGYVWSLMADNFLVRHPDGSEAIYAAEELTLEPDAYWRVVHFEAGVLHGKELATHQEVVDHLNALKKGGVADAQCRVDTHGLPQPVTSTTFMFDRPARAAWPHGV